MVGQKSWKYLNYWFIGIPNCVLFIARAFPLLRNIVPRLHYILYHDYGTWSGGPCFRSIDLCSLLYANHIILFSLKNPRMVLQITIKYIFRNSFLRVMNSTISTRFGYNTMQQVMNIIYKGGEKYLVINSLLMYSSPQGDCGAKKQ